MAICFRVQKDIKKKLNFEKTYAIQNVMTGKALRPFDAHIENDVEIIFYLLKNGECIIWEFIEIAENTHLLKDLFTEKTFQPKAEPKEGMGLWKKSLGGSTLQYWEFLKQTDGNHFP